MDEGTRNRESTAEENVCRRAPEIRDQKGGAPGKEVRPSRRKEKARHLVEEKAVSIRFACDVFGISETRYCYQPKLSDGNAEIADWLIRLMHNWSDWGFGLCFLFLRNVKGYRWNHKRVYRIYKELELNLRIKPKKRIVRENTSP